jgi:hypothetical protein
MYTTALDLSCRQKCSKITKKFDLLFFDFPASIDQYNIIAIKAYLKNTHKILLSYAKIELQKSKELSIKQCIDQRCDNLSTNPSKMIDSILNRKKRSIIMNRLLIDIPNSNDKYFSIDPTEIKNAAINHFQNYALPTEAERPLNTR